MLVGLAVWGVLVVVLPEVYGLVWGWYNIDLYGFRGGCLFGCGGFRVLGWGWFSVFRAGRFDDVGLVGGLPEACGLVWFGII